MSNSTISWVAALRELKTDRTASSTEREERLRTNCGSRGAPALAMSVWRGRSGPCNVMVVQPLKAPDLVAEHAAVILAVARVEHGQASIVAARACEAGDHGFLGWLAACAGLGACELHAYRLAETRSERTEIAVDLGGPTAGIAARMA